MKEVNKDKDPEVGPMLVYLGCLERVVMTVDLLRATSIGKVTNTAAWASFTIIDSDGDGQCEGLQWEVGDGGH